MVERRAEESMSAARTRLRTHAARRWMVLRVILGGQSGEELAEPPGRDLLISTTHTFAEIAAAIDRAFARWDVSHLHEFVLADGRRIVAADDDGFEEGDLDETVETVASLDLTAGRSFEYVFDLGAGWEHRCMVLRESVDPLAELGIVPIEIVAVFGWGTIPDQYGRLAPDSDEG
jgi:hypothetical protein